MASAMADRGVHATLVRTFLALVMLSACSQEPAEQESDVSEPAQKQRAGAQVDCRDEVVAAFELLKTSGQPYRKETISVINDQLTSHETVEFLPPDRMREITSYGVLGRSNSASTATWSPSACSTRPARRRRCGITAAA